MQPLGPVHTIDLFRDERDALLRVLASLTPEQWAAPTVCDGWSVKDVAAHIVADDLGIVSSGRDGYTVSRFEGDWPELLAFINRQNEHWVESMRRLSPRLIVELLQFSGERATAQLHARDLNAIGHPVDWAGPAPAPVWLDVAREYTERWAHQQQIRDGAGVPGLYEPRLFAPVLDAFVRALPRTFRQTPAPEGTHVRLVIDGDAGGAWSLVRQNATWGLYTGVDTAPPVATTTLDQDTAWRLFTKGLTPEAARARATLAGDATLAAQVLRTVSILA